MKLEKYSFGMGDRFARQGKAQLQAVIKAKSEGINVVPVWNKSHREHTITGTSPKDVRVEADAAVAALNWTNSYYVDADHIGLGNVDLFVESSDFFTLDVADAIGRPAPEADIDIFVKNYDKYAGKLAIPGMDDIEVTTDAIRAIAAKFLLAVKEAGNIYRRIEAARGAGNFVIEVSMDETNVPQTPVEMFFILAAIADQGIPAQTIAPRFSGYFHKGVDYIGSVQQFAQEFNSDIAVIAFAVKEFGLADNLKLSVHSGSDKFAIYKCMREAIQKHGVGLHVKTAGTTWLEEIIGLAAAGGQGLAIAKEVYRSAYQRLDELTKPYASVIDIDPAKLPEPTIVNAWSAEEYVAALRHDQSCALYNPELRQLLHVGYKVAAEMGQRYLDALATFEHTVSANVYENLWTRHLSVVFPRA